MKVGILTHQLGANYGCVLQNYAMQRVLAKLGHEPITLRWRPETYKGYIKRLAKETVKMLIGRGYKFPFLPGRDPDLTTYADFKKAHIKESRRTYIGRLGRLTDRLTLDAVVVGSDQIWRVDYHPYIETMFLDFTLGRDVRRVAYAPSFGVEDIRWTPSQIANCRKLLKGFHGIGVREASGVDFCREKLGAKDARLVLDPTLLLGKEDYTAVLENDVFATQPPYIWSFIFDRNKKSEEIQAQLADTLGMPVKICIDHHRKCSGGIDEWISGFKNAGFVITDSFHATVFAIIFNVPFVVLANTARGNARLDSLLGLFGLTDRRASSVADIPLITCKSINWGG